jgi:hypothetical protein
MIPAFRLLSDIPLDLHTCTLYHEHSYRMYALGDYSLLISFLSNYDFVCVGNNITDAAVGSCTSVILQAVA